MTTTPDDLSAPAVAPAAQDADNSPQRPLLRIVRGIPDDVDPSLEVAVLTAVLTTRGPAATAVPPGPDVWSAPEQALRPPVFPSRDGWRNSARPR